MTDFEELSTKFECVKLGMRHTKDGHVISFALNPHDTPHELMSDPLGQRYLIVAVRIDGNDEPVAAAGDEEGRKAIKLAGTLCSDDKFQQYLTMKQCIDDMSEEAAAAFLRKHLGIASRKDLRHNAAARAKLIGLRDEFMYAMRNGSLYR
jgi:hypothetical protein